MIEEQLTLNQIQRQASEYVARLYSGEMSAHEEQQILAWCDADPIHQVEFDAQLSLWDNSAQLDYVASTKPNAPYNTALVVAASILLVVFGCLLTVNFSELNESIQLSRTNISPVTTYETAVGELSLVGLPDGTKVTLNTDTTITIDFSGSVRQVWLRQGEAYFDVAKNPDKVFVINTGEKVIRVVGTKFNVRKSSDHIKVSVTEGLVSVHDANTPHTAAFIDKEDTFVPAGSVAAFSGTTEVISSALSDEIDETINWRRGIFRFENESLSMVVAEFNRYRTEKIMLADEQVKKLKISGVFHLKNGDSIIKALAATLPIDVRQQDNKVTISMKKKS